MNELERIPAAATLAPVARALPNVPGVTFDGRHVAGNRRAPRAGGWHDAAALPDGRVLVSIGDLAGDEPEPLVGRLRRAFAGGAGSLDTGRFADLAGAFLDEPRPPGSGILIGLLDLAGQCFTYAGQGCPAPRLRYADGRVATPPCTGSGGEPAGTEPLAVTTVDLDGVALLLLVTDGVTGADALDAPRLERLLADGRIADSASPAAALARRLLDGRSHEAAEFLAVRPEPPAPPAAHADLPRWSARWSFEATAASSNAVRRAFLACLASKAAHRPVDLGAAELIFGEMIGNVVRHAPGRVEIVLDWTDALPVLHMRDNGPGFRSRRRRERLPVDELSESGRGLFIINACAVDFSVRNRAGRGTHARATLALAP